MGQSRGGRWTLKEGRPNRKVMRRKNRNNKKDNKEREQEQ